VALVALTFVLAPLPAAAKKPDVVVNGGGQAILTDLSDLNLTQYPIQFAISGQVADDGSAKGHINFNFHGEFAQVWGAEPYATDMFRINGKVTSGRVEADGTIVLEGTLTETDYRHGDGVIFKIDDPFVIEVGGRHGPDSFLLQWCLLPEWLVDVPGGTLQIH
jgi:hypothetical protein